MILCKFCNIVPCFPKNSIPRIFCGRSCAAKYRTHILKIRNKKKTGKQKNCLRCQKEFYSPLCLVKTSKYCSPKCSALSCQNASKRKNGRTTECSLCKKCIYKPKSHLRVHNFCSKSCKSKFLIDKIKFPKKQTPIAGINARKRISINGRRVYEHRWLMEKYLGRKLEKNEHIHHINGDPKDNRLENLQVLSPSEHAKIEISERKKSFFLFSA